MSQQVQVATLQERVRVLCGLAPFTANTTITSAGILDLLRVSLESLGDIVTEYVGANLLTSYSQLSTVAGTATVAMPANFSDLVRVTWLRSAGDESPPLQWADLDSWKPGLGGWATEAPRYRVMGSSTIELFPTPQAVHMLRLYYTTGIYVTSTSDYVVMRSDWGQWAVFNTCVMVRMAQQKNNEDVSPASFIAQRDDVEAKIRKRLRRERDRNGVPQIRDVRSSYLEEDDYRRLP